MPASLSWRRGAKRNAASKQRRPGERPFARPAHQRRRHQGHVTKMKRAGPSPSMADGRCCRQR
eukprot:5909797-Prymnesium_polylepis.1